MTGEHVTKSPIESRFDHVTRYHYYFFVVYFCFCRFPSIWHILNLIFLSPPITYTCGTSGTRELGGTSGLGGTREFGGTGRFNGTREGDNAVCPCENPEWDFSVFTKTVQTKYVILCDDNWMISFSETISVFGLLVSSFIFGAMSDKYGRLLTLCVSSFVLATAGCLVTLMPNMATFIIMRFIEGFGVSGVLVSGYVLCVEFCGIKYREAVSAILHIPINLGHIFLPGISYLLRDCDHFQIAISVPMFLPMLFWCILLESPKWLMDNNYRERAIGVMEKFCHFNKDLHCETVRAEIEAFHTTAETGEKFKFYHIFKHKELTKNFLCMSYQFFTCGIGYYGVTQFIGKMSGNIHVNTVVGGSFLVPGSLLSVVLLNKLGRRTFLVFTNTISGCFILIAISISSTFKPAWLRILCAGLSNSGFYMNFIVVLLYCVELFPTSARNSALGALSLVSRIGQMLAPQVNRLSQTYAGGIFGALALCGVLLVLPLPETKGSELPSGLEDIPLSHKGTRDFRPPSSTNQSLIQSADGTKS